MNKECRDCDDRDRSADHCALARRLQHAVLIAKAAHQALDEKSPMMPMDAVALVAKYAEGNTPRQQLFQYRQAVTDCIEAHRPEGVLADVHRIY